MTLSRRLFAVALACAAPLSAQQPIAGSATWHLTMPTPQGNPAAGMLGSTIAMDMTASTDGRHIALEMVMDTSQAMMAGMRTIMEMTVGDDTIHLGVILPATLAGAAGGSPGFRIDMPMSQIAAMTPMLGGLRDSAAAKLVDSVGAKAAQTQYHPLGTTAVVAGLTCENWDLISTTDTTHTCVVPTPPELTALQMQFATAMGAQKLLAQIPGLATMTEHAYGGRKMTAIAVSVSGGGMHMELTRVSATPPDPSVFTLPADLRPMPMPGGGGAGGGR